MTPIHSLCARAAELADWTCYDDEDFGALINAIRSGAIICVPSEPVALVIVNSNGAIKDHFWLEASNNLPAGETKLYSSPKQEKP